MKIAVFYFSGTGSTWWVANQFKNIAENRGHFIDLYSIEKSDEYNLQRIISAIDILGFAYPIYGSGLPKIMRSFLVEKFKNIDIDHKIPVLVLTSMLYFSGDGALISKKYLDKTKMELNWTTNISLTSNISIPGFKVNPVSQEKLNRRMNNANENLKKLLVDIENGKKRLRTQWGLIGRLLGWFQRVFEPMMDKLIKFSVDPDRCIKCLKCVKECPVENITYDEISEKITIFNNCMWCMRCYTRCPTQAVLVNGRFCDPEKFKRLKPISKDFKVN
ncbi:MAG: 4Fe-4S dicluster domain-containing protein [Promethearchaeota archaeon]|nr:MAG: 4Fe-4S dicluster domain-containing protein [Candidatus Lokiarchaeota archaeon]